MARHDRRVGYGLPLLLAIALHLAILVASVLRFPEPEVAPPSTNIVQATLVSTETTTDQAQRAEEARSRAAARQAEEEAAAHAQEDATRQADAQATEEAERQRQAEADDREEARRKAEEQAARRAEEAEQQAREREAQAERRQREEAERQAEAEAERKRQAEAEAERKRQAEAEAERKRQAEAEAERKRQAEAEAERKRQAEAEAERKRQAEAARRAAEATSQGLDRAIEGESDNVANARQASEAANSFINLVRRAVEQAWVIPANVPSGTSAEVRVRLGPSGELFSASVGQSSGNSAFDRSAVQAVEAAAPFAELRQLPDEVQRDYRQFNLRFRPGEIR
ncbi:cell envelope integrity protein TolA [Halomonas aquatica]|uniref:Cell envelope integrity protein TolA n=1 Tax=Halomonas aquatica TaxID=3151123 RepID=A0ABV1NI99_9GAMM